MKAEWPKRLKYKSFLYFSTFYSLFHTFIYIYTWVEIKASPLARG